MNPSGFFFELSVSDECSYVSSLLPSASIGESSHEKKIAAVRKVIVSIVSAVVLVSVGSIPFLGLIVPNVVSLMIGDNMRRTVPWVAVLGAAFVLACDILGRILRFPYEIPISVVVGTIGSGLFLYLLLRKRHNA